VPQPTAVAAEARQGSFLSVRLGFEGGKVGCMWGEEGR
jgi:hypothetical protein